jgi:hypothetical protein
MPPSAALAAAQHLLDTGRPFQAHEVLEAAWKAAGDEDRALWRGLAQFAVGITHLARGNVGGGIAVLTRASEGLAPYAERPPHGVNVAGLRRWIAERIAEAVREETPPHATPRTATGTPGAGTPRPGTPRPGTPRPGTPRPGTPRPGTPRPGAPEAGTHEAGAQEARSPAAHGGRLTADARPPRLLG